MLDLGNVSFGLDYMIAFLCGFFILLIFCVERFNEPAAKSPTFVATLLPSHLASHADYLKAFIIYFFIMATLYVLLAALGPQVFAAFHLAEKGSLTGYSPPAAADENGAPNVANAFGDFGKTGAPAWIPLALVLLLSGAATHYPILNQIELLVRRLTHRIIGIPNGVEDLARRISQSFIDPNALGDGDKGFITARFREASGRDPEDIAEFVKETEKMDFVRRWVRLRFLYDRLENRRHRLPRSIDTRVLTYYESTWNEIKSSIFDLSDTQLDLLDTDPADLPDKLAKDRLIDLRNRIDYTLRNLHALIAASISQSSHDPDKVEQAFRALGLEAHRVRRVEMLNGVIVALFAMFFTMLVIVFLTGPAINWSGVEASEYLPRTPTKALEWATGALFMHGSAVWVSWATRERLRRANKWRAMRVRKLEIPSLQYLSLSVMAYLACFAGLFVWYYIKEAFGTGPLPAIDRGLLWMPLFATVGVCSGFLTVYTMDVAERPAEDVTRARLIAQPILYAVLSGLLTYFLMRIWVSTSGHEDYRIYVSAVIATQGLIIGCIVLFFARHLALSEDPEDGVAEQ